jgi:hypothetical protein
MQPGGAQPGRPGEAREQRSVSAAKSVNVTPDQRTRIHSAIANERGARLDRVDFTVAVGTRIPRTVQVRPVSEDIVRIVPQYRGFDFIVVRDELLIVDPDTLEIVAVLPV